MITNLERIRQMTADELAEFFRNIQDKDNYFCITINCQQRLCSYSKCFDNIRQWLEQKSEE